MSDLHAAIRKRLADRPILASFEAERAADVNAWVTAARDALLATLDAHDPRHRMQATDTGEWLAVDACRETPLSVAGLLVCTFADSDRAEERYVPCPTTLAIAEKLGIEVGHGG